jgi:hypothetical protein
MPWLISESARQADYILRAWSERDQPRLQAELDRILASSSPEPLPSGEAERRELVRGIAGEIRRQQGRRAPGGPGCERMDVCLALLQHLIHLERFSPVAVPPGSAPRG